MSELQKKLADIMYEQNSSKFKVLHIDQLMPDHNQPRKTFDAVKMQELADSIKAKGVLQPLIVSSRADGKYNIVAGERRWRASKLAGITTLPVLVHNGDNKENFELAIIENVQRADLTIIEEALSYKKLREEFAYTQEEIAKLIGKSRSYIANALRILNLPPMVLDMLERKEISFGHARALLCAEDPLALATKIVEGKMNVRATEKAFNNSKKNYNPEINNDLRNIERALTKNLGLTTKIDSKNNVNYIKILIPDMESLDHLLTKLHISLDE